MMSEPTQVHIEAGDVILSGDLEAPHAACGQVLFAHGSGSSRHSPRNRRVAEALHASHLATLLFDLLTAEEEERDALTRSLGFDIGLLARRLEGATDWALRQPDCGALGLGYFGASTGAAAALVAAAARPSVVRAVVSRGGRPDLAGTLLSRVMAPTLLIVGERDAEVLAKNREAARRLGGPSELVVIAGATHLFEEPGALEEVARLAAGWFTRHLCIAPGAHPVSPGATLR